MNKGWIRLHRKIRDCELIWDDKPYSRGQAWIDLLMLVNHEEKEILFDGSFYKVGRGERITSIRKLSDAWGWSRTKTTKFLNELKKAEMIDLKSDTKKTLITVVNYDFYQDIDEEKEPPKSHRKATEKPQKDINNNDIRTINNDKEYIPPLPPTGEEETTRDFKKYSNVENTKFILNNKLYKEWEYIRDSKGLWDVIKEWMEYKDEKKPRKDHHYQTESGISKLLTQFVNAHKKYGIETVRIVVNDSIAAEYTGIVWDWLEKKKQTNANTGVASIRI